MTRSTERRRFVPVADAVDQILTEFSSSALNRLVHPSDAQAQSPVLHPMVVFILADMFDQLWQEGEVSLWGRVSGEAAAVKIEPVARKLNFVSGPRLGEWVVDWTTSDPKDLWRDDRKDLWRDPRLTREGVNRLRAAVKALLRPTAAALDVWMVANAAAPGKYKREATITACCRATGATNREATAAWVRLPAQVKLRRGEWLSGRGKSQT